MKNLIQLCPWNSKKQKKKLSNCVVIIDWFELFMERPSALARAQP